MTGKLQLCEKVIWREKKLEKSQITFLLLFNSLISRITKKIIYKGKKFKKRANDFFIAVLLHFYDLKYLNLTKSWLSNQKSGMVLKVTLIQISSLYL